ncbi:MAG: LPS export ABC transporter permease LptG [Zhengella sp.]|uniref:LPS export ABC transporter permease LptG n=1 Tax=Zhengella sp. TaxID=2282762 RepID=UPI001DB9AE46|nr:LPS export ABC transporter permease LptG [Notoacmeibacter sp.]MCC0028003.1 LPS export ABC transporter permease LptG [Brucellaceae bacterium]
MIVPYPGWTLGRYFLRRYAVITAWFFTGIFALAFLIDFTEFSSRTSNLPKYTMAGALFISAMRIPFLMQQIVPFIALFSGMATLISLNRRHELVVARASGVSAWQFLAPICLGAFAFGALAVTVLNPLSARGFEEANAIEADWRARASNTSIATSVPWLRQKTEDGETIIGAKAVLRDGTVLASPVFIHIGRDGAIERRQDAERAILKDGFWQLVNVRETRLGAQPEQVQQARVATNLRPELVSQRLAEPDSVPFFALPAKIEVAQAFGYPAYPLRMQFQSLIALPALLVAMTLIAATVSLRFVRFGQSGAMIVGGIAAGFLLYVASVLVKAFGSSGFVPPVIAAWSPVVIAAFIGISFLLHREDG